MHHSLRHLGSLNLIGSPLSKGMIPLGMYYTRELQVCAPSGG